MKHALLTIGLLFGIVACGDDSGDNGTVAIASATSKETAEKLETSRTAAEKSGSAKGEAPTSTCLFDCKTDPIAKLSFAVPFEVSDGSCTWSDFIAMPLADGFGVLAWGDCKEGKQVYFLSLDQTGQVQSPHRVVSMQCYKYFHEVTGFAGASDGETILFSYSCRPKAGTAAAYVASLNIASGVIIADKQFLSENSSWLSDFTMSMAYNPEARAFGLALRNNFYRFNSIGDQLGGSVNTYLSNPSPLVQNLAGQWYIFSRSPYGSTGTCSKINTTGNLECDRKTLDRSNLFLTTTGRMLSTSSSYNKAWNVNFEISSFNTDTCSMSKPQVLGSDGIGISDKIQFVLPLTQDSHAILYEDSQTGNLKISVFKNSLTGSLQSIVSIAPSVKTTRSVAMIRGSVIYVLFLDQLGLRLSTSSIALNEGR